MRIEAALGPVLVRYSGWGPVLVVFGLLMLGGLLISVGDTEVKCGTETMHTDEICREYYKNYTAGTIAKRTYDQEREYENAGGRGGLSGRC